MATSRKAALSVRADTYFDNRHASGVEGLALLNEMLQHAAKHRDTDALSRFLFRAKGSRQEGVVKTIIRAAFGDNLTYKPDAKHPNKGKFTIMWGDGPFNLKGSNTYSVVVDAVGAGMAWDDTKFRSALSKVVSKPEPIVKVFDAKMQKAVADRVMKAAEDLFAKGGDIDAIIQALSAKFPIGKDARITRTMENGIEKIAIAH